MKAYTKNDKIMCYGKDIFLTMDDFFRDKPSQYRYNYDKNLDSLMLIRQFEINNGLNTGLYDADQNIIYFTEFNSIGHEMFHVASNDLENKTMGIDKKGTNGSALLEGITEYLFVDTFQVKNNYTYSFEVAVAKVLRLIPGVLRSFFMASYDEFINSFNNKDTIKELNNELNVYNKISDYCLTIYYLDGKNANIKLDVLVRLMDAVRKVIDSLYSIGIENSKLVDNAFYNRYLMEALTDKCLLKIFGLLYPGYVEYLNKDVKSRVKVGGIR